MIMPFSGLPVRPWLLVGYYVFVGRCVCRFPWGGHKGRDFMPGNPLLQDATSYENCGVLPEDDGFSIFKVKGIISHCEQGFFLDFSLPPRV